MTTKQTHDAGFRPVLDDPGKQVVRRNGAPLGQSAIGALFSALLIFVYSTPLRPWNFLVLFLLLFWTYYTNRNQIRNYDVDQTHRTKTIAGYLSFFAVLGVALYLMFFDVPALWFALISSLMLGIMLFVITRFLMPSNYIEPVA